VVEHSRTGSRRPTTAAVTSRRLLPVARQPPGHGFRGVISRTGRGVGLRGRSCLLAGLPRGIPAGGRRAEGEVDRGGRLGAGCSGPGATNVHGPTSMVGKKRLGYRRWQTLHAGMLEATPMPGGILPGMQRLSGRDCGEDEPDGRIIQSLAAVRSRPSTAWRTARPSTSRTTGTSPRTRGAAASGSRHLVSARLGPPAGNTTPSNGWGCSSCAARGGVRDDNRGRRAEDRGDERKCGPRRPGASRGGGGATGGRDGQVARRGYLVLPPCASRCGHVMKRRSFSPG
jgi:hypothetical protein